MITVLQILLLIPLGFFLTYLSFLSLVALLGRSRSAPTASDFRTFALVVPAHNEEIALAPTLRSFSTLRYPRELFSVIVVADNCTDRTAEIAREMGAEVLERKDDAMRGKGYALRWAMDQLLARSPAYDALVVIDADTEVDPGFLDVMNRTLAAGADVVQCSDMVKQQKGAWSAEMTRIGFTLYNHARPLGRMVLGFSAGLRGNGMCFTTSTLREHPWDAYSRAEDLEYGLRLLLAGTCITFAPDAKVFATMPSKPANAESQRARWEGGRLPLIRKYTLPLARAALSRLSLVYADALIDLLTPALVNMLAITAALSILNLVVGLFGLADAFTFAFVWAIVTLLGFVHLFVGLIASRADRGQFVVLLHLPRYVLWKLALYTRLAGQKKINDWIRTTRESSSEHR